MNRVYIALGSNIEPRGQYLKEAVRQLTDGKAQLIRESSIYETEPVGYTNQSKFFNKVVEIRTELNPFELLEACQNVESHLGREREIRWGPRTVDLDILLYNEQIIDTDKLTVPHPRMHERGFVLIPLAEIAESMVHPVTNKTIGELLSLIPASEKKGIQKVTNLNT